MQFNFIPMKPDLSHPRTKAAIRSNPNHHLWKQRTGVWWIFYVHVSSAMLKGKRVNQSLHTKNVKHARELRDAILK